MNDPVLSVRIKNDKEGPQTGDVILNGSAINQWEPGNQYDAGDVAVYNNQFYQSLVEQTAGQTFESDKWQQIGIPDIIINEFEPDTFYYANQAITYDDKLYKAKADFTSGSKFYPEDWDAISGDTYSFTSEDKTVTITLNDNSVDFSVGDYVTSVKNELDAKFDNKVDKEPNKGLSSNDYTADEKTKLQSLVSFFSVGDNLVLDADGRLNAGFSVSFDPALDKNSTNGIQNKPVAEAVEDLQAADAAIDGRITANTNNISANAANIVRQGADIAQLQSDVAAQDIVINNKVDKEAGKELSSNDYTDADQTKLNGLANIRSIGTNLDLTNGVLSAPDQLVLQSTTGASTTDGMTQKAITDAIVAASTGITTSLAAVATSGDYDNLINTPTGETLTIKKNGNAVGTFSTLTGTDSDIDITVPVSAADIGALPASTKYAADLSLAINSSTFAMTAKLLDQAGNDLGTTQTITLPEGGSSKQINLKDEDSVTMASFKLNEAADKDVTLPTSGDGKLGLVKTDSVIDASSANPVQNKVVKAYVDKTVSDGVGKGNKTVQDADGNVLFVIDANDKTVTTSTIPNATATKPGLIYANPAGGWSSKKDEAAIVRSADGVMEIGQLIDFHRAKDDTKDYATRLKLNGDNGNQVDLPAASGTLALTSDIKNNKVTVKDANAVSIGDFTVNQSSDKTITIPRASGTALGMVKLVASTTDIGEGSPLEAGTIYGVYTA